MNLSKAAKNRIKDSEILMKISQKKARQIKNLALKKMNKLVCSTRLTQEQIYETIVLAEHILEYTKNIQRE